MQGWNRMFNSKKSEMQKCVSIVWRVVSRFLNCKTINLNDFYSNLVPIGSNMTCSSYTDCQQPGNCVGGLCVKPSE